MALLNKVNEKTANKVRVHVDDPSAIDHLFQVIMDKLSHHDGVGHDAVVLLCIGTDRSTGDCLGPLIGTQLNFELQNYFHIYGTLDNPVHAGNLQENVDDIYRRYHNPYVIALDACLGSLPNVGCISVGDGALQPGAGVNKSLPAVGDMYITGIVNVGGFMEYLVLQNTRLNLVMKMAKTIVAALTKVAKNRNHKIARSV